VIHKKKFYFIRHGQTDYNTSDLKVDHGDVPLNLVGIYQAQAIEPTIASLRVKSICYSSLRRAKETKEIISTQIEAKHYEIAKLDECSMQVWADMTACGVDAHKRGPPHVKAFMEQALAGINQALSCEGPVLVVAHGGIHWAICCLMEIDQHNWIIDNCLPIYFSFSEGRWKAKKIT